MNKEQFDLARSGILRFCHLVTTPEERESVEYLDLYRELINEESQETVEAKTDIELLDGWADSLVVLTQALISPHATEDEKFNWSNKIGEIVGKANATAHGLQLYDLYGALLEVNRSNMTKVPLLSEVKDWYGD